MRLLHTSDWHLGRTLHGADLTDAHRVWLTHVATVVREQGVDVVLLAGDVFDRALPPASAVRLWDEAVTALTQAGAQLVVSSGNHDSAVRLGAHAPQLARAGVHLRTDPAEVAEPVLLHDEHGPVAVYAVPYLEPSLTATLLARLGPDPAGPVARDQAGVVGRACDLARAREAGGTGTRTVLMAHTWAGGLERADLSASERDIGAETTVGGLDRVPLGALDGFSYVALGHLHGRRTLREDVRYSGSPVAFSFSERDQRKGSWLVDLDAAGLAGVTWVDAPVWRPLTQLTGRLEDLLVASEHEAAREHWVKAVLTDVVRPQDAMDRLRRRFPHALSLEHAPAGVPVRQPQTYAARLRSAADPLAVTLGFVAHVRGQEADPQEQDALTAAVAAVRRAGSGDPAERHVVPVGSRP